MWRLYRARLPLKVGPTSSTLRSGFVRIGFVRVVIVVVGVVVIRLGLGRACGGFVSHVVITVTRLRVGVEVRSGNRWVLLQMVADPIVLRPLSYPKCQIQQLEQKAMAVNREWFDGGLLLLP